MTGPVACSTASGSMTAILPELLRRVIAPADGRRLAHSQPMGAVVVKGDR